MVFSSMEKCVYNYRDFCTDSCVTMVGVSGATLTIYCDLVVSVACSHVLCLAGSFGTDATDTQGNQ